jgi:hypothetical protein
MTPHACSRREFLRRSANGFAMLPVFDAFARKRPLPRSVRGGGACRPHHAPRAKAVIFLYMDGGPSHVDTFDYKPQLQKDDGKPWTRPRAPTQFQDDGNTLGSPWRFHRYGESGLWVSELLPHLAQSADRLCVVKSMVADFSEHTNANYYLHTGLGLQGRPSAGAWASYGLGCDSENLPAFVVLNGGLIPPGGIDCFGNGFLPAHSQGSLFRMRGEPLANVTPREERGRQQHKLDLLSALDAMTLRDSGGADAIAAAIHNQELAFRMQSAVPELFDLSSEPLAVRQRYGVDAPYEPTRIYAQQCLLARRLVERGVRFVEVLCPDTGHDRWDQHSNLRNGLADNCRMVDQPIAALLEDLAARGLLDETLVVYCGEFGRTPFAQGHNGRDHNPFGFTTWMAGGGTRAGASYGATDDYGYAAVENPFTVHDLHATMLHLLGIDHERFTFRFGGRDIRLTDVYGNVPHALLA